MSGLLLVLNAGSSSLKFGLYEPRGEPVRFAGGEFSGIGHALHGELRDAAGSLLREQTLPGTAGHAEALQALLRWTADAFGTCHLVGAGHRVVHGGREYCGPVRLDSTVMNTLRALVPLAPLHQPHALQAIDALGALHPALPQVACFDTAFHHGQPELATRFALPRALHDEGVRRYGFHGLSYEFIASVLPAIAGDAVARGRVVVAHLGAGASLCAMRDGRSVATTMGFTALDGLPMAQRCGNLDPGVVLYLLEQKGWSAAQVTQMLYHQSGLLGVSNVSDDMRTLLGSDDPHAREAVALFVYRIAREIGSLAAALGGLDALVFTAGIGEHAAPIRRAVCQACAWLGLEFDEAANERGEPCLSSPGSKVSAWRVPTDEDLQIARHTLQLLAAHAP
jgi:acetate kinase